MTSSQHRYVKAGLISSSSAPTPVDQFALPLATLLLIFVSTIAWATTAYGSLQVLASARIVGTVILGITLLFCLSTRRILRKDVLIGLSLWTGAFLYGVLSAMVRGSELMGLAELLLNYSLTAAMIFVFISRTGSIISVIESRVWLVVALVVFLYTIAIGGFLLEFPPRFIFENYNREGSSVDVYLYSQGSTKFYGLAAILSSYAFMRAKTLQWRVAFAISTALFLGVSLLAGGRGDFLAAAMVVMIFTFFKEWKIVFIASAGILIIFLTTNFEFTNVLPNFAFYERFAYLAHSAGLRDVLALQSLRLITNDASCMIVGCGYNYFQNYFGYGKGMYPHNLLLESIITYGAPLTLLVGISAVAGASKVMKSGVDNTAFFMIFVFFLIVSLKSGSLIGSWYVSAGIVFLITRFICGRGAGAGPKLGGASDYRFRPHLPGVRR